MEGSRGAMPRRGRRLLSPFFGVLSLSCAHSVNPLIHDTFPKLWGTGAPAPAPRFGPAARLPPQPVLPAGRTGKKNPSRSFALCPPPHHFTLHSSSFFFNPSRIPWLEPRVLFGLCVVAFKSSSADEASC